MRIPRGLSKLFSLFALGGFMRSSDHALPETPKAALPANGPRQENGVRTLRKGAQDEALSRWREIDGFEGLRAHQILEKLLDCLDSPDRDVRLLAITGLPNFAHDFPAFCEDAVKGLVGKLSSLSSDGPEAAAEGLRYMVMWYYPSLIYIQEHVLGYSPFQQTIEKIDLTTYFDPEIRRHLACALTSVAIESHKIATDLLDDLIACFDIAEEDLHCHIASELYQIADAHGGRIAERIYEALKARRGSTAFARAEIELLQHIQGLERRFPRLLTLYPPGRDPN